MVCLAVPTDGFKSIRLLSKFLGKAAGIYELEEEFDENHLTTDKKGLKKMV